MADKKLRSPNGTENWYSEREQQYLLQQEGWSVAPNQDAEPATPPVVEAPEETPPVEAPKPSKKAKS